VSSRGGEGAVGLLFCTHPDFASVKRGCITPCTLASEQAKDAEKSNTSEEPAVPLKSSRPLRTRLNWGPVALAKEMAATTGESGDGCRLDASVHVTEIGSDLGMVSIPIALRTASSEGLQRRKRTPAEQAPPAGSGSLRLMLCTEGLS
jgi:hypothetical protein